jgi:uncharacterized membrane protein YeiB
MAAAADAIPPKIKEVPVSNLRIHGYDIARALAVFGMVIVNFKTVANR